MVAMTYRNKVDTAEAALAAEHEKSEALLHNILLREVAERLKDNRDVIADSHAPVTILFADIVGFTELSGPSFWTASSRSNRAAKSRSRARAPWRHTSSLGRESRVPRARRSALGVELPAKPLKRGKPALTV